MSLTPPKLPIFLLHNITFTVGNLFFIIFFVQTFPFTPITTLLFLPSSISLMSSYVSPLTASLPSCSPLLLLPLLFSLSPNILPSYSISSSPLLLHFFPSCSHTRTQSLLPIFSPLTPSIPPTQASLDLWLMGGVWLDIRGCIGGREG